MKGKLRLQTHVAVSFGKLFGRIQLYLTICGHSAYRTTAILLDTSFVRFRVGGQTCIIRSLVQHCVLIQQVHTYITVSYATICLITKLIHMYLMTGYYTPNDGFTANDSSFYNNKVGYLHYTWQCFSH